MDRTRTIRDVSTQDSALRALLWAVLIGVVLGTLSRYSSRLEPSFRWLGNVGAIWLLVSFFVGRMNRSVRIAAIGGAFTLASASVAHYVPYRLGKFGIDPELVRYPLFLWIFVGGVAGALFGAFGSIQRRGGVVGMWSSAAVMACLAGEALLLFLVAPRYAYIVVGPVQLVAAAALPFVLGTDRTKSYLMTAAIVPFCIAGLWLMVVGLGRVYPGL